MSDSTLPTPGGSIDFRLALEPGEPPAAPDPEFRIFTDAEFMAEGPDLTWAVRGIVPHQGVGLIFGRARSGKRTFAVDLACSVARGARWRDRRAKQGRLAFISEEGPAGLAARLEAYGKHHCIDARSLDVLSITGGPDFTNARHVAAVIKTIEAAGPIALLFVDTQALVRAGANADRIEGMEEVFDPCCEIRRATGTTVVLVHRSSRKGSRGWSDLLRSWLDFEIEIKRTRAGRTATTTKMRDGPDFETFPFKLKAVPLGKTSSSYVVEHTSADPAAEDSSDLG